VDPHRLPPELGPRFSVQRARELGVTPGILRSRRLDRPFHGVRSRLETGAGEHLDAVLAYATRMSPHAFISHLSSAVVWGLPLPGSPAPRPVDVSVIFPRRAPEGRGVRGHSVRESGVHVWVHPRFEVRVSSPASTWVQLAADLTHPYDLVAVGDALVREPQHPSDPGALATIDQLGRALSAGRRVKADDLRRALHRIRVGASSRPETWTRLLMVDAGLPEPTPAFEIADDAGDFVARVDLAFEAERLALEYEGEHHLTNPVQWRRDIERIERLADLGWRVIRVTSDDVFRHPDAFVRRVRRALDERRP
jgi:hypothetical protein